MRVTYLLISDRSFFKMESCKARRLLVEMSNLISQYGNVSPGRNAFSISLIKIAGLPVGKMDVSIK